MKRRRFLKIVAASGTIAAFPFLPEMAFAASKRSPFEWQGSVLGGEASMFLVVESQGKAERVIADTLKEIERLEKIFSLYRPDSAIRHLNKHGYIENPPQELVEVLNVAQRLSELSGGVFDVSVQPLWRYQYYTEPRDVDPQRLETIRRLVDFRKIAVAPDLIRFAQPQMEITLNGIAQGYITDRVSDMLRENGLTQVLVQLGETYGLGQNAKGAPWKIGIPHPRDNRLIATVELESMAVATSSNFAARKEGNSAFRHIIDPSGESGEALYQSVSVVSKNATEADGLSTTLSLLDPQKQRNLLRVYPGTRMIVLSMDDTT